MASNILIIGACGTGKTWVMKKLIEHLGATKKYALGTVKYRSNGEVNILGVYDGTTFEGSDRLSMGVMKDIRDYLAYNKRKVTIAEGDRFMNARYIRESESMVVKISGSGEQGRKNRGSTQSERQIKAIQTRVRNTKHDVEFETSEEALNFIKNIIDAKDRDTEDKDRPEGI